MYKFPFWIRSDKISGTDKNKFPKKDLLQVFIFCHNLRKI